MWRELSCRKGRKERKDCGRVDVGDVLTQRRRGAEYAERFELRVMDYRFVYVISG